MDVTVICPLTHARLGKPMHGRVGVYTRRTSFRKGQGSPGMMPGRKVFQEAGWMLQGGMQWER